jgi:hypothetical protein
VQQSSTWSLVPHYQLHGTLPMCWIWVSSMFKIRKH